MADVFVSNSSGLDSPLAYLAAVTPADGSDLATSARALWVGGAGDIKVTTVGGSTVTIVGVTAGSILPVRVARVWATGTTATNILAGW